MFGKERTATNSHFSSGGVTLISKGTKVLGDLHFSGSLEIEGTVEGNIVADKNSSASVRILEAGLIKGEVRVPTVVINGNVEGDVYASGHVELATKAVVNGNVYYHLIEMVKGAQVNGSLMYHHGDSEQALLVNQKREDDSSLDGLESDTVID